ncbi:hypothetical protein LNV09_14290 [Paucibacter sp. B2R-40]|uniref:hypothetical protein n=1 Tax=Paucibacter sp. B2R-40 TaxID=2893554 RepID=UPI0021E47779|nr:hypothetical protein [Paucibacter sp. B2R-40]MCV2355320.1 hypothetical protein [Paucibacter sp. B2R-40]
MREFSFGLMLAALSILGMQGCASNDAKSAQAPAASSVGGNGEQEFVTGSRIPRKASRPSENVVVKDANEKTGL